MDRRFSIVLQAMVLITLKKENWTTSEQLSGSINVQAAVIRKEIIKLKSAGLVESKEGKGGGVRLARPSSGIRLSEIFDAVIDEPFLATTESPNLDCFVGKQVKTHQNELFSRLNKAF